MRDEQGLKTVFVCVRVETGFHSIVQASFQFATSLPQPLEC